MDLTRANLAQLDYARGRFDRRHGRPLLSQDSFENEPVDPKMAEMEAMNQRSITRMLPTFDSIVARASIATLYHHVSPTSGDNSSPWKECNVSGPLFLVSLKRHKKDGPISEYPRYAIVIMNRHGLKNFALEIVDPGGVSMERDFIFLANQRLPHEAVTGNLTSKFFTNTKADEQQGQLAAAAATISSHQGPLPSKTTSPILLDDHTIWGLWIYASGSTVNERDLIFQKTHSLAVDAQNFHQQARVVENKAYEREEIKKWNNAVDVMHERLHPMSIRGTNWEDPRAEAERQNLIIDPDDPGPRIGIPPIPGSYIPAPLPSYPPNYKGMKGPNDPSPYPNLAAKDEACYRFEKNATQNKARWMQEADRTRAVEDQYNQWVKRGLTEMLEDLPVGEHGVGENIAAGGVGQRVAAATAPGGYFQSEDEAQRVAERYKDLNLDYEG